jgi:hypothetical protein
MFVRPAKSFVWGGIEFGQTETVLYERDYQVNHHDLLIMIQVYGPQTKILEGGTKDETRIFEIPFIGS